MHYNYMLSRAFGTIVICKLYIKGRCLYMTRSISTSWVLETQAEKGLYYATLYDRVCLLSYRGTVFIRYYLVPPPPLLNSPPSLLPSTNPWLLGRKLLQLLPTENGARSPNAAWPNFDSGVSSSLLTRGCFPWRLVLIVIQRMNINKQGSHPTQYWYTLNTEHFIKTSLYSWKTFKQQGIGNAVYGNLCRSLSSPPPLPSLFSPPPFLSQTLTPTLPFPNSHC